jgi:hypothetical protein
VESNRAEIVEFERGQEYVQFEDIRIGDLFIIKGVEYVSMKTDEGQFNTLCMTGAERGVLTRTMNTAEVVPVTVTMPMKVRAGR